jgi:hypothetical protein
LATTRWWRYGGRLTSMQIVLLARRAVTLGLFDTHNASPHLPLSGRTGSQREQAAGPLVAPAVPRSECCQGEKSETRPACPASCSAHLASHAPQQHPALMWRIVKQYVSINGPPMTCIRSSIGKVSNYSSPILTCCILLRYKINDHVFRRSVRSRRGIGPLQRRAGRWYIRK